MKVTECNKNTSKYKKPSALLVFIMIILLMVNICVWTQEVNEINNKPEEKYKMVTEIDDSNEFISIRFVKIEESGE